MEPTAEQIAELGLEKETHWGPVSVAEYHEDGSPVMDDRMFPPIHKHRLDWVDMERWVTPWREVGERETSEQISARLQAQRAVTD